MPVTAPDAMQWSFRRNPLKPRHFAMIVAFLLGCLALAQANRAVDARVADAEQRVEQATAKAHPAGHPPTGAMPALGRAGMRQMAEQVTLLNRDWSRLLNALVPVDEDTWVLEVEVNPITGAIRVSGLAASAETANAYAQSIEGRAGVVSEVRVMTLEQLPQGTGFQVGASWAQ